jgi:hypothetical protein
MAGAVLPWDRQCQLRAEVVRGTGSLRCDLRHSDQRQRIGHSRSAERRYDLYSVFLQWLGRCGQRRAKLYLFPTTLPNANPIGYCNGLGYRYSYANGDSNSYAYTDSDTNSNSYCYGNLYVDAYSYSNGASHCHADYYSEADSNSTTQPAIAASAHSAASPVTGRPP